MKKLDVVQMENLRGSISQRTCFAAGMGIVLAGALGLYGPAIGMAVASADCW